MTGPSEDNLQDNVANFFPSPEVPARIVLADALRNLPRKQHKVGHAGLAIKPDLATDRRFGHPARIDHAFVQSAPFKSHESRNS